LEEVQRPSSRPQWKVFQCNTSITILPYCYSEQSPGRDESKKPERSRSSSRDRKRHRDRDSYKRREGSRDRDSRERSRRDR
jgi:hypothetical protein